MIFHLQPGRCSASLRGQLRWLVCLFRNRPLPTVDCRGCPSEIDTTKQPISETDTVKRQESSLDFKVLSSQGKLDLYTPPLNTLFRAQNYTLHDYKKTTTVLQMHRAQELCEI